MSSDPPHIGPSRREHWAKPDSPYQHFVIAGIEHRILDAIQGHRPRNVAEGYGEVTIKTQAAAVAKMPRYKVSV